MWWKVCAALLCDVLWTSGLAQGDDAENDVMLLQSRFSLTPSQPVDYDDVRGHMKNLNLKPIEVNLDEVPEKRFRNLTRYYLDLGVYPRMLLERAPLPESVIKMAYSAHTDEVHMREKLGILADMGLDRSYLVYLLLADLDDDVYGYMDGASGLTRPGGGIIGTKEVRINQAMSGCTGLLAAMPNGTVVHGRNMDWGGFHMTIGNRTLFYQDVVVEALFTRGGKPFATSVQWPLHTGIHTGMRLVEPRWSYEQNTRHHFVGTSILSGLYHNTEALALGNRRIMESDADFETAVQRMQELRLLSPHYIIMAGSGPYQGAVIAADRNGEKAANTPRVRRLSSPYTELTLGKSDSSTVNAGWHILQTNDDLNKMPRDARRPAGELMLSRSSQEQVSADWVFQTITTPPLLNLATLFTSIFIPESGYRKTVLFTDHKVP